MNLRYFSEVLHVLPDDYDLFLKCDIISDKFYLNMLHNGVSVNTMLDKEHINDKTYIEYVVKYMKCEVDNYEKD